MDSRRSTKSQESPGGRWIRGRDGGPGPCSEEGLETEPDQGARVELTGRKAKAGPAGREAERTSEAPAKEETRRTGRVGPEEWTNEAPAKQKPQRMTRAEDHLSGADKADEPPSDSAGLL